MNALFIESLYEVGWLQKPAGQTRAALELTSAVDRAAKAKALATEKYEQAEQAFQKRDLTAARRLVEEADAASPNQATTVNLRGEIFLAQKDFDGAEVAFKQALKLDPKLPEAHYNLAQILFKKKDYAKARDRFEALFSATPAPGGDKNQAAQIIKFKIYLTLLLEGKDSRAQKMMEQFQFTGDTPALYYAQAAWEFKHNNAAKANDWIVSARKIYSRDLNFVFADSFYDLGWLENRAPTAATALTETAPTAQSPSTAQSVIAMTEKATTEMKEKPWENSLGMRFVPVPGTRVLFSVWETRVKDYRLFVEATKREWPRPQFKQNEEHPAVNVTWEDAAAFCEWLTESERKAGMIAASQSYRLPTDLEWSAAVGLEKEGGTTPTERNMKVRGVYPWGTKWPPPKGSGNYDRGLNTDDYGETSPAGSFEANRYRIHDMGGNAWEWCQDWLDKEGKYRVLRGASWFFNVPGGLLSSCRAGFAPVSRHGFNGFRCVLVVESLR